MEANINTAIKKGYLQQVRFLVEFGHSINERDGTLRTPLINCAFIGDEEWALGIARLFLEKGATISLRDKFGLNALHYATLQERRQLVQLYLSAIDFNVNAADKYGNTALHYASSLGNEDITRDLIMTYRKYGLNINTVNKKGETALIQAWKAGYFRCGDLLASYSGTDEEIKDIAGLTARDWQQRYMKRIEKEENQQVIDVHSRPRTAFKHLQLNSTPISVNYRPPSAPVVTSAKRRSITAGHEKENNCESDPVPPVLRKAKTTTYYQPASIKDLRNNPQYIFQISPVEYFSNKNNQGSFPFAGDKYLFPSSPIAKKLDKGNNSWRFVLKSYLSRYNFQFAHSYRKTAIPPEPEPEENIEERPESPAISEVAESDHGKRSGKKTANSANNKHQKQDKGNLSRKTSSLAVPNLVNVDSSSSEDINLKGIQRRVSRLNDEYDTGKKVERMKSAKGSRDGIQSRTSFIKK